MKKICTVLLAAAMLMGAATGASAIDFKAQGQWLMGFGMAEITPVKKVNDGTGKRSANTEDQFLLSSVYVCS